MLVLAIFFLLPLVLRPPRAATLRRFEQDFTVKLFSSSLLRPALPMALLSGSWMGSTINAEDITYLRNIRRLPRETEGVVCLPEGEQEPRLEGTERVVFYSHIKRGFGLPASHFLCTFLVFFGLQPHHLGANTILQPSGFVTLCEGYLGAEPLIDLWVRFFALKQQGPKAGEISSCGATIFYKWTGGGCPKMPLGDSTKKW